MEDVDGIIIPILRQIGCNFKPDVKSISQFGSDDIVAACSHALYAINNQYKFPTRLPEGNAQRFRICTNLSNAISELGFTGENGYQAFLYPNEQDMRKLLSWLVGRLPKPDEEEGQEESAGPSAVLNKQIHQKLKAWSSRTWNPVFPLGPDGVVPRALHAAPLCFPSSSASAAVKAYVDRHQPLLTQQCERKDIVPSVLEQLTSEVTWAAMREKEWEAGDVKANRAARSADVKRLVAEAFATSAARAPSGKGLADGGDVLGGEAGERERDTRTLRHIRYGIEQEEGQAQVVIDGMVMNVTETGDAVDEDEDTVRKKHEEELSALQAELQRLGDEIAQWERSTEQQQQTARLVDSEIASTSQATHTIEEANAVKKRTLDLLPEAEKNIAMLKEISAASAQRLLALAEEWEAHRNKLLAAYRRKKQQLQDRKEESRVKLEQIKRMRTEMKDMQQDILNKQTVYQQVTEELNKLPKAINRQVYVQRIMDIVKTLDKQKDEMNKILADVRNVQKDINSIGETSKRSFALTDERIFQVAQKNKKDPQITQSYKFLVQLRKGFDKLVQAVEDMGKVKNEIRELQTRIDEVEAKNSGLNMERIKTDLTAVRAENAQLTDQVKAAQASGVDIS